MERLHAVGDDGSGWAGGGDLVVVPVGMPVGCDPVRMFFVVVPAAARVPVRQGRGCRRAFPREQGDRPEVFGDIREVDEHLDLAGRTSVGGDEQGVVEVVAVQGLVVVGCPGVLCPEFDGVAAKVVVTEQHGGELDEPRVHAEQVQGCRGRGERRDPAELAAEACVSLVVGIRVELVGSREHRRKGIDGFADLISVEVRRQDHEAVAIEVAPEVGAGHVATLADRDLRRRRSSLPMVTGGCHLPPGRRCPRWRHHG